jgi:hypothetical protein
MRVVMLSALSSLMVIVGFYCYAEYHVFISIMLGVIIAMLSVVMLTVLALLCTPLPFPEWKANKNK